MARTATNSGLQQKALKARRGSLPLGRIPAGKLGAAAGTRRIAADFRTPSLGMNLRLYRLYTELTNKVGISNIQAALDRRFPGYTISLGAFGRYDGTSEQSVVVDILTHDKRSVTEAAAAICIANEQESVLVVETPLLSAEFVMGTRVRKKTAAAEKNSHSARTLKSLGSENREY